MPGSKQAEYCSKHAPDNYIDVKHKRCKQADCNTRASFGLSGYSTEYCAEHKLPNMIARPLQKSKTKNIKCLYCETDIHYTDKFCSSCKQYIKLGTTVKFHAKEQRIKYLLESHNIDFIHDKIVDSKCSKKRPDFNIPTSFGYIIIEVDEYQHKAKNYSSECEMSRMKQIYMDLGTPHVLFIRYNPDYYKTKMIYKRIQREKYLMRVIYKYQNISPDTIDWNLAIIYLFYDNFDPTNLKLKKINPYSTVVE